MTTGTLSILGLYNADSTIFDNFRLPEAISDFGKEALITELLVQCAEFEVLYTDPAFMKFIIGRWSALMVDVWEKLYKTITFQYDPIYNYDRTEEYTDTRTGSGSITYNTQDKRTINGNDVEMPGRIVTRSEQGYNTPGFIEVEKSAETGANTYSKDETDTNNRTGTDTTTNNDSIIHKARMYGNIGTVSTQNMIAQEREIARFNIYQTIIDDFKHKFCLMIY